MAFELGQRDESQMLFHGLFVGCFVKLKSRTSRVSMVILQKFFWFIMYLLSLLISGLLYEMLMPEKNGTPISVWKVISTQKLLETLPSMDGVCQFFFSFY